MQPGRLADKRQVLARLPRLRPTLHVANLVMVAGILFAVAASPALAQRLKITACTRPSKVVAANERIKIAQQRGTSFLFACSSAYRRGLYVGGLTSPRPCARGMFNYQLAGAFLAYQVQGEGCSTGLCAGPVAYVQNMARRSEPHRLLGAVDLILRSDGAAATIERVDQSSGDPAGDTPGPGPFRVVITNGAQRTVYDEAGDIDPTSLAWRGSRLYWLRGGQPQTARTNPEARRT
jgi:hypothetical protein